MQHMNQGLNADFIMLDLNKLKIDYEDYNVLSATEKVDLLCKHIIDTTKQLPANRMKIFVWPEYGIANPNSLFCDNDVRQYLKEKMSAITKANPEVCIVAGTVSTKKHFAQFNMQDKNDMMELYKDPILAQYVNPEKDQLENVNMTNGVDVVRNTCYIFQGDQIHRHDKLIPYFETIDIDINKTVANNLVFRPSKSKHANPIIELMDPITKQPVRMVVEICAEHASGYAAQILKNNRDPNLEPHIHIVVAASVVPRPENVCANYFIEADPKFTSRLITNDSDESTTNIRYYQVNAVKPALILKGPLAEMPMNHFRQNMEVLKFIDEVINKYDGKNDKFSTSLNDSFRILRIDLYAINKNNEVKVEFAPTLDKYREVLEEGLKTYLIELDSIENSSFTTFFSNYFRREELDSACNDLKSLIMQIDKHAEACRKIENPMLYQAKSPRV